jgi:hypothetical protein
MNASGKIDINARTTPSAGIVWRRAVHTRAATPKTNAGMTSDTPSTLNRAANKRIDTAPLIASGANRFSAFPMDCDATLMTIDFQADAEF